MNAMRAPAILAAIGLGLQALVAPLPAVAQTQQLLDYRSIHHPAVGLLELDYEVLMLARMKESYERSHDNTFAVADGLESSAPLVTSAAAIMVSVFVAFALARIVVLQATGVGLALAVALDATLVRALLVPATMRLFGDWNWWAPPGLRGPGVRH